MPPKGRASKKRARSPSGVKVDGKRVQAQTRSSKRLKKDAPGASVVAVDEVKVQVMPHISNDASSSSF